MQRESYSSCYLNFWFSFPRYKSFFVIFDSDMSYRYADFERAHIPTNLHSLLGFAAIRTISSYIKKTRNHEMHAQNTTGLSSYSSTSRMIMPKNVCNDMMS